MFSVVGHNQVHLNLLLNAEILHLQVCVNLSFHSVFSHHVISCSSEETLFMYILFICQNQKNKTNIIVIAIVGQTCTHTRVITTPLIVRSVSQN